jgi:DNA-directed RNA polymerase beta subunit
MPFQGYNQDDGIIFNEDAFQRGMFRNMNYRSYTCYEENDKLNEIEKIFENESISKLDIKRMYRYLDRNVKNLSIDDLECEEELL